MALSPSAAANRRFGFQFKPEITPPPIPTNPGTALLKEREVYNCLGLHHTSHKRGALAITGHYAPALI
jgi:hypothetical protein